MVTKTLPLKPLADCRLYTFVDDAYLHGRDPAEVTRQLCDGGADLIQLRAKTASIDELRRTATALLEITERYGVGLVVNDHPLLAAELGAPWCHLGQEDFFDTGHRRVDELFTGSNCPEVGLSSHAPAQAERAIAAGAGYIAIGPVYPTPTKPGAAPVTLEYVRWANAHVRIPWFAIGGITMANVDAVLAAGARRICVVSAILNAPDLVRACQDFRRHLDSARIEPAPCGPAKPNHS